MSRFFHAILGAAVLLLFGAAVVTLVVPAWLAGSNYSELRR